MKICELHNLNTFIILEGIYYTFWICYWLILVGFNLRWTVMLAKQLFRLFAIISSCHTISLFFTSIILLVFRPLLKKKKFIVLQSFVLSEILLTVILLTYFSLVWRNFLLIIIQVFIRPFFCWNYFCTWV